MTQQPLDGYLPQRRVSSGNTPFNALTFFLAQALGRVNTATLVKVVAVHIESRTGPVGTVDVQPLVDMADGAGQAQPHTTVFGIPYLRIQGGAAAVIVDPVEGDIGFCVFADRDISKVKASGDHAPAGSDRRFDYADGFYLGGWNASSAAPSRYLLVDEASIEIVHPSAVHMETPTFTLDGDESVNGKVGVSQHYEVSGTQVVGVQQGAIPNPVGGSTVDAQARTALIALLQACRTHGLIAP